MIPMWKDLRINENIFYLYSSIDGVSSDSWPAALGCTITLTQKTEKGLQKTNKKDPKFSVRQSYAKKHIKTLEDSINSPAYTKTFWQSLSWKVH